MKKILLILLGWTLVLSACSSGVQPASSEQDLLSARSYRELYDYLQEGDRLDKGLPAAAQDDMAMAEGSENLSDVQRSPMPQAFEGADILKAKGDFLYLIANQKLLIVDASDPENLSILSVTEMVQERDEKSYRQEQPIEFYVDAAQNRLTLILSGYHGRVDTAYDESQEDAVDLPADSPVTIADPDEAVHDEARSAEDRDAVETEKKEETLTTEKVDILPAPDIGLAPQQSYVGTIVYDISDPRQPQTIKSFYQQGYYIDSQPRDGIVYVISNHYSDYREDADADQITHQIPATTQGNPEGDWQTLPADRLLIVPDAYLSQQTLVSAVDVSGQKEPLTQAILGTSGIVHFAGDYLYVLSWRVDLDDAAANEIETGIYRFRLQGLKLQGDGQAKVAGSVQAIDAHDGFLRLWVSDSLYRTMEGGGKDQTDRLLILDDSLQIAGQWQGLPADQAVTSQQFFGDRAFLSDPYGGKVWWLDLSQPQAPQLIGELELDSQVLAFWPYDETTLIAAGYESQENDVRLRSSGLKISWLDIADVNQPHVRDALTLGGSGSYSDIFHQNNLLIDQDHNRFAFSAMLFEGEQSEMKQDQENREIFQGMIVLSLEGNTLSEVSRFQHASDDDSNGMAPAIRKALINEDHVVTLSDAYLEMRDRSDLQALSALRLPGYTAMQQSWDQPLPIEADDDEGSGVLPDMGSDD